MKLTTYLQLRRLRMSRSILLLSHMPSWGLQGQFYVYLYHFISHYDELISFVLGQ
jgi:hypothetical protein